MLNSGTTMKLNEKLISYWFIITCFFVYFFWALSQPFNAGPDEAMRFLIPRYIFNHSSLPHALDPEVIYPDYGFSYANHPMLSYILGAVFMKIASFFSLSNFHLLVAARMASVLSGTVYVYFVSKISNLLFNEVKIRWLFIVLCSCWPQAAFMFTYVNCDAMAIAGVSIVIYSLLKGYKESFKIKTCITLAIGVSICTLTYENSYIFIPISFVAYLMYFILYEKESKKWKKFFINGMIVLGVFFLLTGWHFIRNYIVYQQLFPRGIYSEAYMKNVLPELSFSSRKATATEILSTWQGKLNWIKSTLKSFIAMFGQMSVELPGPIYLYFYALIGISTVSFFASPVINKSVRTKTNLMLAISSVSIILFATGLSYYYSQSDYQPQGRYVLTAIIPVCYIITSGISYLLQNRKKLKSTVCNVITVVNVFTLLICPFVISIWYKTVYYA